ncbi:MAG: MFS transporter [Actinomycetota bacterium]|nr:MFS transporter [Actinomycetota bacterium]
MTAAPSAGTVHGEPPQMTHRQIMVVMSGLMLGVLLAALDQTIVSTALPRIVGEFKALEHLSWVVTAYLLTSTASTPLYGKISDLYGRKPVFQFAIVVFLIGSILCGLAQSMGQLIAFRAIQGLGAGGLMVMAITIIGDVIPPRERGRYQGYFGGVFGVASVLGPLLGGYFTDHLTWRWIFYVNVPVGIAALFVVAAVLKMPHTRREHKIDYAGSALLVAAVSCLLLVTVWGGRQYAWTSAMIIALTAVGLVLSAAFVVREHYATEPILPLALFRNRVFSVANAITFIVGLAMFGGIVYIPVYLQIVKGRSPTESGLLLLPLMAGLLFASIGSGRIISRIGRLKIFPIIGTALMAVSLVLLSRLSVDTSQLIISADLVILGLGLGCVMQVLILAVQNAVDRRDMGAATSSTAFFRTLGGAFGTAIFGAVLTARLHYWQPKLLPAAAGGVTGGDASLFSDPQAIKALPGPIHDAVLQMFVRSIDTVFLVAVPIVLLGLLLAFVMPDQALKGHEAAGSPEEPVDTEVAAAQLG